MEREEGVECEGAAKVGGAVEQSRCRNGVRIQHLKSLLPQKDDTTA